MKDFSFRSVVRASNDLVSSTSNLNNHRALRQIFVYAAQKKHSAVEVISDAFTGGIVASFRDRNSRILNAVLLPSPKSMAALAPLIASGFFVPSSSRSTESTFEVWTPLSECMWRDAFTMTVLLFPDCFADGVQSASDEEDEGYYSLRVRQAEKSPVPSSSTASLSYVVENSEANHHRSHNTPVRDSPSLSRQPSEGQANPTTTPRHLTTCSMASMSGLTTMSGGEVPSMASADVVGMHAIRLQTAVQLLSTLNDALHDVQCRLMALDYQGGTSSSPASGSSTWAPRSSRACLNEMSGCLMRTKMLLLCCVAATEAAYRPHSAMPAPGELVKHEEHPWVLPRQTLMELVGELCNDPIERWPCGTVQETEEWYDALLERLSATYLTIDGRLCASFDAFVQSIAWDGQHGARQLTRLPKMVLNRPNDGKPAVVLGIHHHLPRPKLPVMPLQAGELQFLTRSADGVLLFDGAPSPVADFFRLCSTSRWSDAQAEEVNHFLATPFASYTHPEQIIMRNLLCRDSYLEQFLSTNASVLARVVMWVGDATASGTADSLIATMAKEMISNVQQIVLLRCKFSVCVVQYLHELLSSSRLDKDTFLQWIDHCCAHTADVRSHIAVIDALVDFAAARQEWQLEGDLRLRFAELKLQRT